MKEYTNLDKVFWPKEKFTKGDVLTYYQKISKIILPYLKDRPESLLRNPSGIKGPSFFQKDVSTLHLPNFVETEKIYSESNKKKIQYLLCQNAETLLYLANLGCIELNPWSSRVGTLEKPDYMILDLDPGKNKFEKLIEVAKVVHDVLDLSCETHFIKTSGKKGLHILVPLGAKYDYSTIRKFSELLMMIVNRRLPALTSIERHPAKRGGKIYLDYLQNSKGQTIAAPYSVRPWPGATVSTPLKWSEVKKGLDPAKFNIKTVSKRVTKLGDLWKDFNKKPVNLAKAISCLEAASK